MKILFGKKMLKKLLPYLLIFVIGSIDYYIRTEKYRQSVLPLVQRNDLTETNIKSIRKYKDFSVSFRKTSTGVNKSVIICPESHGSFYVKEGIQHLMDLPTPKGALHYLERLGFLSGSYSLNRTSAHPVILFAASSNHFQELVNFLSNLNSVLLPVYPTLKRIFYNLGLTRVQLLRVNKTCGCEIRNFPFESYPNYFKHLKTYAWKPIIIQTVLQQYHFVMYMDVSIRFQTGDIKELLETTKKSGFMYLFSDFLEFQFLHHTLPQMFQFFDVDMCLFQGLTEYQATMVIIHDNWLTHYVLMKWWVTCAVTQNCIAPPKSDKMLYCDYTVHQISKCHRFDQSALNILVNLIYPNPLKQFISESYVYTKRM